MLVIANPAKVSTTSGASPPQGGKLTVVVQEMLVRPIPHLLRHRTRIVQIHAHPLLLTPLAREDICTDRLLHFRLADQHLVASLGLARLDFDDLATGHHPDMLQPHFELVVGEDHADERGVERPHAPDVVLGRPGLDQAAHGGGGVHAVRDGAGELGVFAEDARDVDGVVVARDAGIGLVAAGRLEEERGLAVERDGVLEVDGLVQCFAVALQVVQDRVAVGSTRFVLHGSHLDDLLARQLQLDLTERLHRGEDGLVLEARERLELEHQRLAQEIDIGRIVHVEPLLALQHGDILGAAKRDLHRRLDLPLEGVLIILIRATVEELARDLHHFLAVPRYSPAHLYHLARILVDDRVDLRRRIQHIALLQRRSPGNHAETVAQMHQLQQIPIDLAREDGFRDGFPADHNRKVHGREDLFSRPVDKSFAGVAHGVHEVVDRLARDGRASTVKSAGNRCVERTLLVAEPDPVVELLDAVVPRIHYFADRRVAGVRAVLEPQLQRRRPSRHSPVLNKRDRDLVVLIDRPNFRHRQVAAEDVLPKNDDRLPRVLVVGDLNHHPMRRREDARHGIRVVPLPLHEHVGGEEGRAPGLAHAAQEFHPSLRGG